MATAEQQSVTVEKQSVTVSGESNVVASVGGDIGRDFVLATTVIQQQKSEFVSIPLDQFQPPRFPSPRNMSDLFDTVCSHNLLVLSSNNGVEKDDLARHTAWYLAERLKEQSSVNDHSRPILEWRRSSDPQSISATIRTTNDPAVFILPQIEPQDVRYDLNSIQKAAASGQHYVIVSTDKPFASWKFEKEVRTTFWCELPDANLWEPEGLAAALIATLNDYRETLPAELLPATIEPDQVMVGNLTYRNIAQQLKTPANIIAFVRLLRAEKQALQEAHVLILVKRALGDESMLKQWYHTQLRAEEQTLALGLNLLDGLYHDQFFAALEVLTEGVWRRRAHSLDAFDYNDLDNLGNLFKTFEFKEVKSFSSNGASEAASVTPVFESKIEMRSPELRRQLLNVIWHSHRRRILATLPALAQLVKDSAPGRSYNPELFGNQTRQYQLRTVISETLSEIGLISTQGIENTLIQLAADEESVVQTVVASAMARWREYGLDQELFQTLQRWQFETRIVDLINEILNKRDKEQTAKPRAYIRATVALAVSYAAQYDRPNELSEKLYKLLKDLAEDPNTLVLDRFCSHTLPWIVPLHLVQLRDFLHDLPGKYPYYDFIRGIAFSLARAYQENAGEVIKTLDLWSKECEDTRPETIDEQEITPREALLATVMLTYGHIEYDTRIGPLTLQQVLEHMQLILARERHPVIRAAVIVAASIQARRDFNAIEALLPNLIKELRSDEVDYMVKSFTEIYLEQRQKLEDSEDTIEIGGKRYPIWIEKQRPLTDVEKVVLNWLKDRKHPVAQHLGTYTSVSFASTLDEEEQKLVDKRKEEKKGGHGVKVVNKPFTNQPSLKLSIFQSLALMLTGGSTGYSVLRGLIPAITEQKKKNPVTMEFVLKKWKRMPDKEMKNIANKVYSTLAWVGCLTVIFWLSLVAIIIGIIALNS